MTMLNLDMGTVLTLQQVALDIVKSMNMLSLLKTPAVAREGKNMFSLGLKPRACVESTSVCVCVCACGVCSAS